MLDWSKVIVPMDPERMDPDFCARLENIQEQIGHKLIINCGYRSPDYEESKGRSGTSSHCEGKAVDIHCTNPIERYHLISSAINAGIYSIGIYKTFLHFDCSEYRSNPMIWIG